MRATRVVILSQDEVGEAIKAFVRAKYHEKIEKAYHLTDFIMNADGDSKSYSFVYEEAIGLPLFKD